jgi:hypothetical protein
MTWNETHARTRIIRAVEAAAAIDMNGVLPWNDAWAAYFDGPSGLVKALRARWNHMCEAQLDVRGPNHDDEAQYTYNRLRRTQAGVLAILKAADGGYVRTKAHPLGLAMSPAERETRNRRVFRFHGGPTIPV